MKKTGLVLLILTLGALVNVYAGGKKDVPAGSTGSEGSKPVTIEFWSWLDEEPYLRKVIEAYKSVAPNVTVNPTFSADIFQKYVVAMSGGATMDVFCYSTVAGMATYVSAGQTEDLSPYITKYNIDTGGIASLLDAFKKESGTINFLPYRKSVWVLFYNKKIFDEAGIPYPDPVKPITWEEYTELGKRLTKGSGENKIWGILNFAPNSNWFRIPANTAGANNPMKPADLEQFKKAAKLSWDFSYTYNIQPPYSERTGTAGGDYIGAFLQGKYAMFINGDWVLNLISNAVRDNKGSISYDMAPLPYWAGSEPTSTGVPCVAAINVNSKVKDEAFKFASFLAGEDGAKVLAGESILPAWSSPSVQDIFLKSATSVENGEAFFNQKVNSQSPLDAKYDSAMRITVEEVSLYLLEEQDLNKTFDTIARRIKEEVR
jgi:multiple sugar transport system substrate-binding protein